MVTMAPSHRSKYWALVDQSFQSAANFATMVLAARHLSVEGFAQFSLAYLAVLFAASFHRTLVTQPMNVLGNQDELALSSRAAALWRAHGAVIPAGALLVLLISPFGFAEPWLILATIAYLGSFFLQEMRRRYAYTRFNLRAACIVSLSMGTVQLGVLLGLIDAQSRQPAVWMGVLALSQLFGLVLGTVLDTGPTPAGPKRTAQDVLAEQFNHSRWVVLSQVVFWSSSQIYPFLVAGIGASQAAAFNAGMSILNAANVLRMTLANYLPSLAGRLQARGGDNAVCQFARRTLLQLLAAGLVAWLALLVLAEPVVTLLYGDKFPGAVDVLRWVALGVWASMFSVVLNAASLALDSTQNIFVSNALGAAFTCTAGVYFTHKYGLTGAIWSNVAGYLIPTAYQLAHLWPRLRATT